MVRTYPQGFAQLLSVKGACVTGLASASPVLHDEEPEPPSPGRSPTQETLRQQFPAAMLHYCPMSDGKLSANSFLSPCSTNGPKSDRKLSANSFLSLCSTTAPCQTGNYPRTVSCRYAPPLPHAEQETFRNQFPAAMLHHCPMPHRKLFVSSFLSSCSATAPCRMGNHRKKTVKK